ncbi:MAG: tetratricopeptide repeat protein [Verrucomicrobiota bacterium]
MKINPDYDSAHYNLGNAFLQKGKVDEAITQYQQALKANPDYDSAHINLGNAFLQKGKVDEAIIHYQQGLKINPDDDLAHNNLGFALVQKGRLDEAITQYQQALKINPDFEQAHNSLGYALIQKGQLDEAMVHYERALEINPGNAGQCNHLAWLLATHPQASVRNGDKAIELAQQLNQLSGGKDPTILQTLAAADAETKQFRPAATNRILSGRLAIPRHRSNERRGFPASVTGRGRKVLFCMKLYAKCK